MTSIIVNGARPAIVGEPIYIGCTGRTCRRLEVQFEIAAKGKLPEISWRRTRYGAGEAGAKLTAKRSEEHTSELQSLMRHSYAVFCLKKKKNSHKNQYTQH